MTITRVGAALAFAGVALRLLSLVSCSAMNTTGADGGADASTQTAGGQCTRIETAYCQRRIDCLAYAGTLSQCVNDANLTCCADKCASTSSATEQAVSVCVATIAQLDCNSVATSVTPQACVGIPKVK